MTSAFQRLPYGDVSLPLEFVTLDK